MNKLQSYNVTNLTCFFRMIVGCCECDEDVSQDGSHKCIDCNRVIHAFCGDAIGEEGYGQTRRCSHCNKKGKYLL